MIRNKVTTLVATAALGLSIGLVGCAGGGTATTSDTTDSTTSTTTSKDTENTEDIEDTKDTKDSDSSSTQTDKKSFGDLLKASGYQGTLEDGKSIVYMELADDTKIVSLTDEQHQGDDAETYTGKATKDASGKVTITDEESGKSISLTITENGDGTAEVDVDGHGKGSLKSYEGNLFSVIGSMAEDDAAANEGDATAKDRK